jgi:hypothetical protein
MAKDDTVSREEFEDFKQKHNDLCDYLGEMKLNPLADFDIFKAEESYDEDELAEEDSNEEPDEETNVRGF